MKAKHKRLLWLFSSLGLMGMGVFLLVRAFEDTIVFYYTPTQVEEKKIPFGKKIRLGGLVERGSLQRSQEAPEISFYVTDGFHKIHVTYRGILPQLFQEGRGVVAGGYLIKDQAFLAQEILAKHDENYRPPSRQGSK